MKDRLVVVAVNRESAKLVVASLSDIGRSVLLYSVYLMEEGKQLVVVDKNKCMEELDIKSAKTFYKAIKELIEKGIISKVKKYTYEVNKEFYICKNSVNCTGEEVGFVIGK